MFQNELNVDWNRVCACKENKKVLLNYIEALMELKNKVDECGICAFDSYVQQGASDFEKIAIDLVSQGCMPEIVSRVLNNLLLFTVVVDEIYTKNILFGEFILMLQKGNMHSQDMKRILMSYLGVEYFYM